ncbi:MAG TPA: antitoxin Xre/MbcA/ParS toxin-binding domain-containing protein [Bryobacteraceae bacterium]|nr:antitoxin Xre/MbcA/ParS toxin-binding domain-containing protein [Bryobacteraceae bacterium]
MMKTAASVLELVVDSKAKRKRRDISEQLVDIGPRSVPWSAVDGFSKRLGVEPALLLRLIGIPVRTALRRKSEGYLKPDEADRLLRIGRVLEEATRVFGEESRAAGWLSDPSPMFHDAPPLQYLDSDGGAQAVLREIGRIGYGLFA